MRERTSSTPDAAAPPERRVYTNRTLNLRGLRAIGYDMDYTLVHYHVAAWEEAAYEHTKQKLLSMGWPVAGLRFEPEGVIRGLVFDIELGNVVKTNRFGYVKRAMHGARVLDLEEQRKAYGREIVDLSLERFVFMNTLFSISEGCLYRQLVELLDAGQLPGVMAYRDLYKKVRTSIDEAHFEGFLKAEIMASPERFVDLDPDMPRALLDQKQAGKKLLLITNSDWDYTRFMMGYAFDRFLPEGTTWRALFDVVIASARKPEFFVQRAPLYEVVSEQGDLRPALKGLQPGGVYVGGSAHQVEQYLGAGGDQILFVGDHIWGDVHVSKSALRWRTALVLRELEDEIVALRRFDATQAELDRLMDEKEALERAYCQGRLRLQRLRVDPQAPLTVPRASLDASPNSPVEAELLARVAEARDAIQRLDLVISPLAAQASEVGNATWGPLLRAGNDKSALARQLERSADIYTSRVSNFLFLTPFAFLRSPRGSLPHDPGPGAMG